MADTLPKHVPRDYEPGRKLEGYEKQDPALINREDTVWTKYPIGETFVPQPNNWTCGPTSLLNALTALGDTELSLDLFVETSKTSPYTGTDNDDIVKAAKVLARGREVKSGTGADTGFLQNLLRDGYVVIVNFRHPDAKDGHFSLLEAVGEVAVQLADTCSGPVCVLPISRFDHRSAFGEPLLEGWYVAIR